MLYFSKSLVNKTVFIIILSHTFVRRSNQSIFIVNCSIILYYLLEKKFKLHFRQAVEFF